MHDMWQKEKSQARSKDPQKPAAYGTDVPFFLRKEPTYL